MSSKKWLCLQRNAFAIERALDNDCITNMNLLQFCGKAFPLSYVANVPPTFKLDPDFFDIDASN